MCGDYKQFGWIRAASVGSIGLGVLSLAVMLACAGLAFASRELQYVSFVAGWNILRVASAIQVLAQGFIAVMLSFWGTVVLTEHYFIKLIAIVGIAALVAGFMVIVAIFAKPDDTLDRRRRGDHARRLAGAVGPRRRPVPRGWARSRRRTSSAASTTTSSSPSTRCTWSATS